MRLTRTDRWMIMETPSTGTESLTVVSPIAVAMVPDFAKLKVVPQAVLSRSTGKGRLDQSNLIDAKRRTNGIGMFEGGTLGGRHR